MAPCRTSAPVPTLGFAGSGHPVGRRLDRVGATITRLACGPIGEERKIDTASRGPMKAATRAVLVRRNRRHAGAGMVSGPRVARVH